jgi:hypothetical protein
MRARYGIYANKQYLLETFSGAIRYEHLKQFVQRQHVDVRIAAHFHTLSDFSKATLRLSIDEAKSLAALVCDTAVMRAGRRALVIVGTRNFGFADTFRAGLEAGGIHSQCFTHRDAALTWLGVSPLHGKSLGLRDSNPTTHSLLPSPLDLQCERT